MMREPLVSPSQNGTDVATGCAYPIHEPRRGAARRCARPRQPGSMYCPMHHASCHLRSGSPAEALRLDAIEAIAGAVGGRCGHEDRQPPPGFLARLEKLTRNFL